MAAAQQHQPAEPSKRDQIEQADKHTTRSCLRGRTASNHRSQPPWLYFDAVQADEVVEVGDRTGLRPPAAKIEDYDPDDPRLGRASRTRCTWGGGDRNNPCRNHPKYTVTDKSDTRWACCDDHLPRYLASRPPR
ncbi:hypothetical protein ACIBK9_50280 [Nonomuraea sp. NPDC050227]|uniref:hypothetical protein n=1 Tax=Nonomuraea sp. NPDC050227 TaxID=3364360 RepID=UPI00378B481D